MAKRIRAERVAHALSNLAEWRSRAQPQGATHLLPMLALIERGAGTAGTGILMNERPHEYDFWDRYFRVVDGNLDPKPYFNPVTSRRAEKNFPHSNAATIRKNTFAGKWGAAAWERKDDGENWSLADTYADVFRDKALTKSANAARVPVIDVAAIMLRDEEFNDAADARALEAKFRERFPQREADYQKIFVFNPEDEAKIFAPATEPQDYRAAILDRLVGDVRSTASLPPSKSTESMDPDDPFLVQFQQLLALGTSGIIFAGIPGTGKSYYAKRIASHLAKDPDKDIFKVQFHPSYGYEDFVEGYRPDESAKSGYKIVGKTFLEACRRADEVAAEEGLVFLIIDEINRGDPARIFGELLTYIERKYRGEKFILPFTGGEFSIPRNLVLVGTMNPHDRSVAQADAAFVRRFDQIDMAPSREVAEFLIERGLGFTADQVLEIGKWFETVQRLVPFGIGHSFFDDVKNLDHLKLVWKYRMLPTARIAIELNDGAIGNLSASFDALIARLEGTAPNG